MTVRSYRLAAASIALCLGLVAAPARAAFVTITLDNPNQSVTVPASGSITLDFTGTVTIAQGATFSSSTVTSAYDSVNDFLIPSLSGLDLSPASNGGSVSGLLFTITIDPGTPPGFYSLNPTTSVNFPEYGVTAAIATGGTAFGGESYTITVNAGAVPEPSALALTACGAGLAALGLRHRRPRR
jgi:hypothetical protein